MCGVTEGSGERESSCTPYWISHHTFDLLSTHPGEHGNGSSSTNVAVVAATRERSEGLTETQIIQVLASSSPTSTQLTLWSWALLERPLDSFPAYHGPRRFNTEFTRALHLFLSLARPIQSTSPHPTSPRSILILSTHLRLDLPSGPFPSGFPTNNLYAFPLSPIRATWYAHLIFLDLIILIILGEEYKCGGRSVGIVRSRTQTMEFFGEEYKSRSSSLCNFLHSPVIWSLFGPNLQPLH
jgi:hypothetical protein